MPPVRFVQLDGLRAAAVTPPWLAPSTEIAPENVVLPEKAKQNRTSSAAPLPVLFTTTVEVTVSPAKVCVRFTVCSVARKGEATSSSRPTAPMMKSSPSTPGAPPDVTRRRVRLWLFASTPGLNVLSLTGTEVMSHPTRAPDTSENAEPSSGSTRWFRSPKVPRASRAPFVPLTWEPKKLSKALFGPERG